MIQDMMREQFRQLRTVQNQSAHVSAENARLRRSLSALQRSHEELRSELDVLFPRGIRQMIDARAYYNACERATIASVQLTSPRYAFAIPDIELVSGYASRGEVLKLWSRHCAEKFVQDIAGQIVNAVIRENPRAR